MTLPTAPPRNATSPPRIPPGSFASSEAARRRMQQQARTGTAPELAIRRAVHRLGYRYRVDRAPLAGVRRKADLVFTRPRVAVFVDGCFWHGCPEHGSRNFASNGWYWPEKIASNKRRDAETDARLAAAGWASVRIWEHEPVAEAAQRVADAVGRRSRTDRG